MAYDYQELRGKIVAKCRTLENFSKKMGISIKTLSQKLNNNSEWKQTEILKACSILGIELCEIQIYFFTAKVQSA